MEILLVERPVARDLGPLDPVEPLRLFEPEAARIGEAAAVHLRIGFRIDARVLRPIGGNGIDVGVGHAALLFATCLPKRARKAKLTNSVTSPHRARSRPDQLSVGKESVSTWKIRGSPYI